MKYVFDEMSRRRIFGFKIRRSVKLEISRNNNGFTKYNGVTSEKE